MLVTVISQTTVGAASYEITQYSFRGRNACDVSTSLAVLEDKRDGRFAYPADGKSMAPRSFDTAERRLPSQ